MRDEEGEVVTELGITAVPIDRTPFPLPSFFEPPVYFTVQPGGAYVFPDGARIIYPNSLRQPPARGHDKVSSRGHAKVSTPHVT